MAEISAFFNYRDEDAERYPAEVFAEYFASFVGNGVFGAGDNLRTYCAGNDRMVRITPGRAWINGYYYRLRDEELAIELSAADATLDRIDRVVLRLNVNPDTYAINIKVLTGIPAEEPVAPELVRTGDIFDISIALVSVTHNTATVDSDAVTDTRLDSDVCGLANSALVANAVAAADSWEGNVAPRTQVVYVPVLAADDRAIVGLGDTANEDQRRACREAMISPTGQADGSITLTADGRKPEVDLPIVVMILE